MHIPSVLHHYMDDVESIVLTSCQLLDATEVRLVAETEPNLLCFFALDVATPHAEANIALSRTYFMCV